MPRALDESSPRQTKQKIVYIQIFLLRKALYSANPFLNQLTQKLIFLCTFSSISEVKSLKSMFYKWFPLVYIPIYITVPPASSCTWLFPNVMLCVVCCVCFFQIIHKRMHPTHQEPTVHFHDFDHIGRASILLNLFSECLTSKPHIIRSK